MNAGCAPVKRILLFTGALFLSVKNLFIYADKKTSECRYRTHKPVCIRRNSVGTQRASIVYVYGISYHAYRKHCSGTDQMWAEHLKHEGFTEERFCWSFFLAYFQRWCRMKKNK
jgi:hypothetical protein